MLESEQERMGSHHRLAPTSPGLMEFPQGGGEKFCNRQYPGCGKISPGIPLEVKAVSAILFLLDTAVTHKTYKRKLVRTNNITPWGHTIPRS